MKKKYSNPKRAKDTRLDAERKVKPKPEKHDPDYRAATEEEIINAFK